MYPAADGSEGQSVGALIILWGVITLQKGNPVSGELEWRGCGLAELEKSVLSEQDENDEDICGCTLVEALFPS